MQWVYTVKGEDKKKEERNVYLDGERAKELLKNDEMCIRDRALAAAGQGEERDSDLLPHDGQMASFHLYLF